MELVDSHCHLQDEAFDEDRQAVIERSLESLSWIVVIGDDLPTSRAAVELTRDRIYATVGIHPYHAESLTEEAVAELATLAESDRVVGIGEIGLDYFKYNQCPRDRQHDAFRKQLEMASQLDLPVVIHNRESDEDLCAILDEYHTKLPGGIMHCFAGDAAFVDRCLSWDFHISFAGNVTFPKAEELREAARRVPIERLLVETDSPYLAPQPVRGKRCEPAFVMHTARLVAEAVGVEPETLYETTTANARRVFRVA